MEALQAALDRCSASGSLAAPPAVAATPLGVRELVSYAHRLSYTTRAPPGFVPGQSHLGQFQPPAPQDLQLRSSQLHEFSRQYQERQRAAQQTAAVAAAAAAAQQAAPPQPSAQPKAAPTAPAGAEAIPGLSPEEAEAILASMPAGWKPGDVVSLPTKPAPPAGGPAPPAAAAVASPMPAPAAAAAAAAEQQQVEEEQRPPSEEREEVAVPQAPPLFSFALNQDLDYLAGLSDEDFGSASEAGQEDSDEGEEEESD